MSIVSKKIRQAAKGQDCTLRLSVCNHNPETTVLAHIGRNSGVGMKCGDNMAVFACYNCHAEIDSNRKSDYAIDKLRALEETQEILFKIGLMVAAE